MNVFCTIRARATALTVLAAATLVACSGSLGTGGSPTTTAKPLSTEDMCTRGQNAFQEIDELARQDPQRLDKIKKALERLDDAPPTEIHEDMKAWIAYVQGATAESELANPPADMRVSISRIDQWWATNCGKPLIQP